MAWAKVKNPMTKPIGWWYHKLICELGYYLYEHTFKRSLGLSMYYNHLNKLCEYGFNLYGDKI